MKTGRSNLNAALFLSASLGYQLGETLELPPVPKISLLYLRCSLNKKINGFVVYAVVNRYFIA